MWKTKTSSPSMATESLHSTGSGVPFKDKEVSVSARKLAATLWEINDFPPSRANKDFEVDQTRSCKETMTRSREKVSSMSRSGLFRPHMSDPSHSPTSERMKGFEGDSCKRRVSALSHHHHSDDHYLKGLGAHNSALLIEDEAELNMLTTGDAGGRKSAKKQELSEGSKKWFIYIKEASKGVKSSVP
ncbi:hypothetical protein Lalb_Chr19g0136351 [Lupinus albus]|uniref:Uncharacterized protein n=1 Tax=Lupinus albus TaxID=3870 RepID=A0A6A4NYY7_LUPAL|nr:hypothetical protein Lalb_Chr19g0136351 [Lupinus albus]